VKGGVKMVEETTPQTTIADTTIADERAKEQAAADTRARNISEIDERINRANSAAKRLEEANKKAEDIAVINSEIVARNALGGIGEAGQELIKKEETPLEYAKKLRDGII